MRFQFLCLFCGLLFKAVFSQDVFGCGGFVQSTVPIKYEKVEVKLYTQKGAFKSKTECAPNNGYFLVAIYDKGDYVLKINPPEGWGFVPQEINLKVDGVNDPCSKGEDLNFVFSGFTMDGIITSFGKDVGPSGVKVTLSSKDVVIAETATAEGGSYVFNNVMPDDYVLYSSHSTWAIKNNEVLIKVVDDNIHIKNQMVVAGYDVKGHVLSSSEPIQDVKFVLFSGVISKKDVLNCKDVPANVLSSIKLDSQEKPLCIVMSQNDGSFLFPSIPTGSYVLVPYYATKSIVFDILPSKLAFSVNLKSIVMKTPFQVYGFSVRGKVLDTTGKGIGGVELSVSSESSEKITKTMENGEYSLENVTTGHYMFTMKKEHYFFDEEKIHISPNTATVKDIMVKEYSVCGSIVVKQMPTGMRQLQQVKLLLQPEGQQNTNIKTTTVNKDGKFCFQTKPGTFKIEVPVIESEVKLGFLLSPSNMVVDVINKPLQHLVFKQFLATVSGTIDCIDECNDVAVSLMAVEKSEKVYGNVEGTGKKLKFTIPNVLPGQYKVTPQRKKWCWNPQNVELDIKDADVGNIKLSHSGYYLKCLISHNITLNFALENSKEEVGTFELKKGENQFCLKTPGVYVLNPKSCYKFDQETYMYNTAEPQTLSLDVAFYKLQMKLETVKVKATDLKIEMKSLHSGKIETIMLTQTATNELVSTYEALSWGRSSEEFIVTPTSNQVLFQPVESTVTITESCPGAQVQFEGHQGIFIEGSITPAFPDVVVNIKVEQSDTLEGKELKVLTDDKGAYRVGPMHKDTVYEVTASKDGYHIFPKPNVKGSFIARKLGHISVTVVNESEQPMSNVFLSLSGSQYRNNNFSKDDGSLFFPNLSPGQYFLKPMQKEFSFDPVTKMIDVSEGEDVVINIKGKRVAFSCSGTVALLAGIPEEKIGIEAVGLHKCSEYHEATFSDGDGNFRIRGLQPGCSYNIKLVKQAGQNEHVERLAPENYVVQVQQQDIRDIHFLVFMRPSRFYVTAQIEADARYLHTLKILLYDEENMDSPVHTVNINTLKFIQLPPLTPKMYVIKLVSTLSSRTHDVITTSATVKADANLQKKHIKLKFEAKEKKIDLEPTQSVIALPFAVALIFLIYNYDAVITFLMKVNVFIHNFNNSKREGNEEQDGLEDIGLATYNKMMKKKRR